MKKKILFLSMSLNLVLLICIVGIGYKIGGISVVKSKIQSVFNNSDSEQKYSAHYYDKKTSFEILPETKNNIVFIGDSITEGCEWSELLQNSQIINRGISTDTTSGILNRLKNITDMKPTKAFIMIGINDIGKGIPLNLIKNNYKNIISNIKKDSPNTQIYVQSVLPCNQKIMIKDSQSVNRNVSNITNLNKELINLSKTNEVIYLDLYSVFCDKDDNLNSQYTNDGLHINGQGYLIWADKIKQYVK